MSTAFETGPHGFVLARDAAAMGRETELRTEIAAGFLERVRVGVFRPAGNAPRRPHELHAELVRAAALSLNRAVFTSYSAAALLDLPIMSRSWPNDVHTQGRGANGSRRRGVVEHSRLAVTEFGEAGGIATTSAELTLVQLCRNAPFLDALVAMDAALRAPRYRRDRPALTSIDRLYALHRRLLPYRGSRKTEAVLRRATHLSDSPLETGSRVLIEESGFEAPVLQHRLELPELGRFVLLDFSWPSVGAGAEADGRGKYLAATAAATADTVIAEKDRENAVRRRLRAFDRWDWAEYRARHPVVRRLEMLGVPKAGRR